MTWPHKKKKTAYAVWSMAVISCIVLALCLATAVSAQESPIPATFSPVVHLDTEGLELPQGIEWTLTLSKSDGPSTGFTPPDPSKHGLPEGNPQSVIMPDDTSVRITGGGKAEFSPVTFTEEGWYWFEITGKVPDQLAEKATFSLLERDGDTYAVQYFLYVPVAIAYSDEGDEMLSILKGDSLESFDGSPVNWDQITSSGANMALYMTEARAKTRAGAPPSMGDPGKISVPFAGLLSPYQCAMRPYLLAGLADEPVEPVTFTPSVSKSMTADSDPLPDGTIWTFNIELADITGGAAADDVIMPDHTSVTIEGEGEALFEPIAFRHEGIYYFCVSEVQTGGPSGTEYDENVYLLRIPVGTLSENGSTSLAVNNTKAEYPWDDGADKIIEPFLNEPSVVLAQMTELTKIPCWWDDDSRTSGGWQPDTLPVRFRNTYHASAAPVVPVTYRASVEKTIDGAVLPADAPPFIFELSPADDEVPDGVGMPENTTVAITGEGTAQFDPITFTQPGVYQFMIRERTENDIDRMRGASPWIYPWGLDAPNKCLITS